MSARAWIRAARLPAQSNIALPLLVGQALAVHHGHRWSWPAAGLAFAFGLFDQLYIVFANDVADVETDRGNRTFTPFSGGSRVLVEGALSPRSLGVAAGLAAALAGVTSAVLAARVGSLAPLGLFAAAVLLLHAYSFRPLRLSYRGGGEVAQVIGTGVVLPLYGWVAQTGTLHAFPRGALLFLLPIRLACAIATALPDEPSDRASDKRTLPVAIGSPAAGVVMAVLAAASIALYARGEVRPLLLAVPAALAAVALVLARARPGTLAMTARVAAAVGATLAFEGVVAWGALAP